MRWAIASLLVVGLTACRDKYSVGEARYDPSQLTSSGGEVSLSDGSSFDYAITSDRYKQWDAARKGFSKPESARFGDMLQPQAPTGESIRRAIAYVEGRPGPRASIERAGMTVRDFVQMTVALEQQMRLATERRDRPDISAIPVDTFAIDSAPAVVGSMPGELGPSYPYTPVPVDTPTRVDTVFLPAPRDSTVRDFAPRESVPRDSLRPRWEPSRDSVRARRDRLRPPRDTVRPPRDTTPPPRYTTQPPRDTVPTPPDSLISG